MKALRLNKVGTLEGIAWEDVPDPIVGEYDVLVKIKAASLNYRDYGFITGAYSLVKPLPIVLGSDGAGVVECVGARVTRFKPGDRVISLLRQNWGEGKLTSEKAAAQLGGTVDGVFSEYYSFQEESLLKAPSFMTFEEAATLPTAGLTAFRVLIESGLENGQKVLVQGTGAVSLFALQIAVKMGFQVIATTGNEKNETLLKSLGAHEVINYKKHPQWQKEATRLTSGRGVDLIVDVAGGESIAQSLEAVALNGEIAVIGFLNGTQSTIDLVTMIRKNVRLSGYTTGSKASLWQFVQWLEENRIHPVLSGIHNNFDDAFRGFEKRDPPGKIAVSI